MMALSTSSGRGHETKGRRRPVHSRDGELLSTPARAHQCEGEVTNRYPEMVEG